jgi:hypothetical protein
MHTIPTFITSLSILRNNQVVQLNVQALNEVFWGIMIEQHLLLQPFSLVLPEFSPLPEVEPILAPEDVSDEMSPLF